MGVGNLTPKKEADRSVQTEVRRLAQGLFHGGMGYMEEYPLARYFRDSRLMSIGAGADEIMLGIIAKYEGIAPPR